MSEQINVPNVKDFYIDILCQCFSPCGNYLVAGSIYGYMYLFDLRAIINSTERNVNRKPSFTVEMDSNGRICSLLSAGETLIIGALGKVLGIDWKSFLAEKPKILWSWNLPKSSDQMELLEVNALAITSDYSLYIGCGDDNIYHYSLEDGRLINTLRGHSDYNHDLKVPDENQLISCGEDGTVRIWDTRTNSVSSMLEPYKNAELARPHLGKWVGTMFVDKPWLLCGGGVRASLWHIPSLQMTTMFPTNDSGIHACMIHEERVLIGSQDAVEQFSIMGAELSSIRCSSHTILSMTHQESPHHLLSIAGTSPYLDFCTSFDYRERVLSCF